MPAPTWETSATEVGADDGWEQVGLFDEEGTPTGREEAGNELVDAFEAEPGENGFEEYEENEYEAEEGYGLASAMELAQEPEDALEEEDEPTEAEYLLTPPPQEVVGTEEPEQDVPVVALRPSEESLLYEAGCLFLDENRVAVSMLQRRFELDFERACELLDRLQEEGLIGPYVGGRTREILLTREEWDARAASGGRVP